jgi:hypothetical protein
MSYTSVDRLKRTCDLFYRTRRVIELFNKCLEKCEESNEARIAIVDFLDPLVMITSDCVSYFHEYSSGLCFLSSIVCRIS